MHEVAEREETRSGTRSKRCGEVDTEDGAVDNIVDKVARHEEDKEEGSMLLIMLLIGSRPVDGPPPGLQQQPAWR